MSKITQTEYETVEKKVTKYQCDECKAVVNKSEINTVRIFEGYMMSGTVKNADETKHLCDDCNGIRNALDIRQKEAYLESRWEGFRGHFDYVVMAGVFLIGFGIAGGLLIATGVIGTDPSLSAAELLIHGLWGVMFWVLFNIICLAGLVAIVD